MNRSTLRDDALRAADAYGAQRWDASAGGEVDRRMDATFSKVWRRILNANRHYRVGKRTPTSDAEGRYLKGDLAGGAGDTLERLYRILLVVVDGAKYRGPVSLIGHATATAGHVWYESGTSITVLPVQAGKIADAIWVNWIPQRPSSLSADSVAVDFPDGYEEVLVALTASHLLMKGGAETKASLEIRAEIQEDYDEMLQDLARVSTAPTTMAFDDAAGDWGAE